MHQCTINLMLQHSMQPVLFLRTGSDLESLLNFLRTRGDLASLLNILRTRGDLESLPNFLTGSVPGFRCCQSAGREGGFCKHGVFPELFAGRACLRSGRSLWVCYPGGDHPGLYQPRTGPRFRLGTGGARTAGGGEVPAPSRALSLKQGLGLGALVRARLALGVLQQPFSPVFRGTGAGVRSFGTTGPFTKEVFHHPTKEFSNSLWAAEIGRASCRERV